MALRDAIDAGLIEGPRMQVAERAQSPRPEVTFPSTSRAITTAFRVALSSSPAPTRRAEPYANRSAMAQT